VARGRTSCYTARASLREARPGRTQVRACARGRRPDEHNPPPQPTEGDADMLSDIRPEVSDPESVVVVCGDGWEELIDGNVSPEPWDLLWEQRHRLEPAVYWRQLRRLWRPSVGGRIPEMLRHQREFRGHMMDESE